MTKIKITAIVNTYGDQYGEDDILDIVQEAFSEIHEIEEFEIIESETES